MPTTTSAAAYAGRGSAAGPQSRTTSRAWRAFTAAARSSSAAAAGPPPTMSSRTGRSAARTSAASIASTSASSLRSIASRETVTSSGSSGPTPCASRNAPPSCPGRSESVSIGGSSTHTGARWRRRASAPSAAVPMISGTERGTSGVTDIDRTVHTSGTPPARCAP